MSETLLVVDRPAGSEWAVARAAPAPDHWCSDGRDVQGVGRMAPWTIFLDGR